MEKKKIKLWKKFLIVILILLAIFIVSTARKMIIIKSLQNKVNEYANSTNYYVKINQHQGNSLLISETYKKDEKSITKLTHMSKDNIKKLFNYQNGDTTNSYIEVNNEKIVAMLNTNGVPSPIGINNWVYTENIWQFLIMSVVSSIESVECNGKQCYKISNAYTSNILYMPSFEESEMYIDKETGLMVRMTNGTLTTEDGEVTNIIADYNYKFNTVTEEDIKEPDATQYKEQR